MRASGQTTKKQKGQKRWHQKSVVEKTADVVSRAHARPSACIFCETKLMPQDLASHRNRCPGRVEPDPLDLWEGEALSSQRGMPVLVLRFLAFKGAIRSRKANGLPEYLVRDVEQLVTARKMLDQG